MGWNRMPPLYGPSAELNSHPEAAVDLHLARSSTQGTRKMIWRSGSHDAPDDRGVGVLRGAWRTTGPRLSNTSSDGLVELRLAGVASEHLVVDVAQRLVRVAHGCSCACRGGVRQVSPGRARRGRRRQPADTLSPGGTPAALLGSRDRARRVVRKRPRCSDAGCVARRRHGGARPDHVSHQKRECEDMHVIIATDGSKQSLTAASYAMGVLDADEGHRRLGARGRPAARRGGLRQRPRPRLQGRPASPEWSFHAEAEAATEAVAAVFEEWGPKVHRRTRSGSPANEIIKAAAALGAGLIVVASGSRGISETVLLGSTAQRVQQYAPCPVLVVRTAEEAQAQEDLTLPRSPGCPGPAAPSGAVDARLRCSSVGGAGRRRRPRATPPAPARRGRSPRRRPRGGKSGAASGEAAQVSAAWGVVSGLRVHGASFGGVACTPCTSHHAWVRHSIALCVPTSWTRRGDRVGDGRPRSRYSEADRHPLTTCPVRQGRRSRH